MKFADKIVKVLLDASPDAIVIHHQNGAIESVNTQTERWFGYQREELIGQPLEILLPERFRNIHVIHRDRYSKSPTPRPMGTGLDLFALRKDNTEFPVDISIGSLRIGNELYFLSNIRDITEKNRLEIDRVKALQTREQLLGIISHDLKNPLTAILMNIQLAPKILGTTPEIQKWLHVIRTASEHMNTLIQDILTYQKAGTGVLALNKQLIEVNSIIDPVMEIIEPIAIRKSINLKKNIPSQNLQIFCDKDRVFQAISNLLNNAVKFTPEGGCVELQVKEVPEGIKFSVSDTGEGIPEKDIPRLFNEFWQAQKTAKLGTGLGLTIVKAIVEAHGGNVGVRSQLGKGSEFFFILPSAK
jgi:protein-histidine pros-kinase